jgi:citrate synthase
MTTTATWKTGLEDVIAARSGICRVDGEAGRLYYRGYEIGDLATGASFEDVTHLLWFGELPAPSERAAFRAALVAERGLPDAVARMLRSLPPDCHPLDALRTAVSLAAAGDADTRSNERDANVRKALRLMNLVPATVAAWHRIRRGQEPIPARKDLGHAAHFLYLLSGTPPDAGVERLMDTVLTLHAEHEFNASTFALRVAVATLADLHAAMTAAVATLKGPRHGGANEDVLAMLHEIGRPERADAYLGERLGARASLSRTERSDPRARVPGFGHRVYKVDDARARVLKGMAENTAKATGRPNLFEVAERVYTIMKERTSLPVNVDFFSAVVYDSLEIPPDFCTSIFATGRVAGWCAHALEQFADNRLIRPRADYTGPSPRALPAA